VTIPSYPAHHHQGRPALVPIHRFYHGGASDHFYSTNIGEGGPHGYASEGVGFQLAAQQTPGLVPVYRYWKSDFKDHFYTTNAGEIGVVTQGMSGKFGYVCEGILGYISPNSIPGTIPVYRYWNESVHDHFYTTNASEIGTVVNGAVGKNGYACEGVLGYAYA
jgi:hypothetical protein